MAQVAEVELDAEDVDSRGGVAVAAGLEDGRLGDTVGVRSQGADRLYALGGGACGREQDEVGGQGSRRQELIDQTLPDA